MKQQLRRAMSDPDHYVVEFEYEDKQGNRTRRVASPIRFAGPRSFLALCLSREAPRMFQIERCRQLQLKPAWQYCMPVPIAMV